MKPTVGRIVHYSSALHRCYPAIVVAVDDDGKLLLYVISHTVADLKKHVPEDGETPHTWHWPEREGE